MSAPSKTSRLGRGSYQRPSADVLDQLTDPGLTPPVGGLIAADKPGNSAVLVTTGPQGTGGTLDNAGIPRARETEGTWDTAGVAGSQGASDYSGVVGTADAAKIEDNSVTSDTPVTLAGFGSAADTTDIAGVAGNSGSVRDRATTEIKGVSATQGARQKRTSKASVPAVTDVASGDRGTSDAPAPRPAATPRDHVKVARPLVDEMRDAVWFLSEHGRPRVQLGELLDEAISAWLKDVKAQHTRGATFPVRGRLR